MTDSTPRSFAHPGFQGWIGAAREDITPPVGIYARNWGAAAQDVAEGVHRPLTAAALTLQAQPDDLPLVLVSLDLGWWRSFKDEQYVRRYVLEQMNLGAERLMLACTHTHAGPVVCREDEDKPGGHLIAPYLDFLREAILRAARNALAAATPSTLDWSYGKCGLAHNRDLPDPDRPRGLCGYNPAAPADDTLLVGRVTARDGRRLATLVNYACHPTTLAWENRLLSPDFVGAMRDVIEANTDNAICLYFHGASGELAPREQYTADTSVADANGRQLGFAALSTLAGMLPCGARLSYAGVMESGAPLATWRREPKADSTELSSVRITVEYPLQPMPSAAELNAQSAASQDRVLRERLNRKRRIREAVGDGATTPMPAWIWRIGDAFLVGHPNEAYSLLQTTLRQRFPGRAIAVMNVVNGHFGYLPPAHLYNQDIYPVWQTPFGSGSLDLLIRACEKEIQSIMTQYDDLTGKRIVICEDEGITVMQLEKALTRAGLLVVGKCGNGHDAVEIVLNEKPDIVLMDIVMPGQDGLAATGQIMGQFPTCIVMLTANTDKDRMEQARGLGAAGYISKPIMGAELLPALKEALQMFHECHP